MRLLIISMGLVIAGFPAFGEEAPLPAPAANCPLCELPNRSALFAGLAKKCPADCAGLCCTGTERIYRIGGVGCSRTVQNFQRTIASLEGAELVSLSLTGLAVLRHDPEVLPADRLRASIEATLFTISAEQVTLAIPSLADERAAGKISGTLKAIKGVRKIETLCHRTSQAVVAFDPAATNRKQITAALTAAGHPVPERD